MKNIKKLLILIFIFSLFLLFSCEATNGGDNGGDSSETDKDNKYLVQEEKSSFEFFWEQQKTNPNLKGCGLIPDRYPSNGLASIASVGFGLASFIAGVENKWITYDEAKERCILTLSHVKDLDRIHGFYYHFYQESLGTVANGSEVSNIDSAIFLCGALIVGEYFKGEVETLAREIYDEVDWPWFVNKKNQFYMAYDSSSESFAGAWDTYAEQLMMYFLGAGSTTHPIDKVVYDSLKFHKGSYKSEEFINSWYGALFTYQFSHAFIDFRNILDPNGIDWFENSVQATVANYNYCVDMSRKFQTFQKNQWGITACDTPTGYSGELGTLPSGNGNVTFNNDGTVAPCGAIGSIVFWPEKVISAVKHYATMLDGKLIGDYGFKDAFNFEDSVWIAGSVIGIDKGITVLMIENYRSEIIWKTFMKLDIVDRAIERLQFTKK